MCTQQGKQPSSELKKLHLELSKHPTRGIISSSPEYAALSHLTSQTPMPTMPPNRMLPDKTLTRTITIPSTIELAPAPVPDVIGETDATTQLQRLEIQPYNIG
jgi:hypothetical protein